MIGFLNLISKKDRGGERWCTLKQGLSLPKDPASSLCMRGSFFKIFEICVLKQGMSVCFIALLVRLRYEFKLSFVFDTQAVLADLSTLKVMPLIQIFLFATAI